MFGRPCPECGYSSHDGNETEYHNNCLRKVHRREVVIAAVASFVMTLVICALLWGACYAVS